MKLTSAAGLGLGCLALGIVLGKGPLASRTGSGTSQPGYSEAGAPRATKSARFHRASLHPGIATIRNASPGELAALTEQAATMYDPVEIQRLLSECLLHMTAENWRDVVNTFNKISVESGRDPAEAWKLALFRSGQVAGPDAMDTFLGEDFAKANANCWHTLYGWSSRDPRAALDWLRKVEAEGHSPGPGHYEAVISGAALGDPQAALKLLGEIPASMRVKCTGNVVWNVVQNGGTGALDSVLDYASTLDPADGDDKNLAEGLFRSVTDKLLWQADHTRDVQQGCDVVLKLANEYQRDPTSLTLQMIDKYRWYGAGEKIQILATIHDGLEGDQLEIPVLIQSLMRTMNLKNDEAPIRDWIQKHPDSPLAPHLSSRLPSAP